MPGQFHVTQPKTEKKIPYMKKGVNFYSFKHIFKNTN